MINIKGPWSAIVAIIVFFALIAIAAGASGLEEYTEPLWNTVKTLLIIVVAAAFMKTFLFRE